jgi:hypothetical protein
MNAHCYYYSFVSNLRLRPIVATNVNSFTKMRS